MIDVQDFSAFRMGLVLTNLARALKLLYYYIR